MTKLFGLRAVLVVVIIFFGLDYLPSSAATTGPGLSKYYGCYKVVSFSSNSWEQNKPSPTHAHIESLPLRDSWPWWDESGTMKYEVDWILNFLPYPGGYTGLGQGVFVNGGTYTNLGNGITYRFEGIVQDPQLPKSKQYFDIYLSILEGTGVNGTQLYVHREFKPSGRPLPFIEDTTLKRGPC